MFAATIFVDLIGFFYPGLRAIWQVTVDKVSIAL